MSHPLTEGQLATLARASEGLAPVTLRELSELRWLEHLGLVAVHDGALFHITKAGHSRLVGETADLRVDG